jgi:opacity protein-like surface antigen
MTMLGPRRKLVLILAALAVAMLAFAGAADAKKKHKKKPKLGPIVTATATATGSTAGQIFTATATCPVGTNAVGGGFSSPPVTPSSDNAGIATASHKVGANQWTASEQYLGDPGAVVLTTYVYCRRGAPVTTPVSTATPLPQSSTSPPFNPTASNASCPAGQVQLSGGSTIDAAIGGGGIEVLLISSNRVNPLTWQATALAVASGHTLTTQADCAAQPRKKKKKKKSSAVVAKKKKKKAKRLVTPAEVIGDVASNAPVTSATAAATCPPGSSPVNGGFSQPGALSGPSPFFFFITESRAVGNAWHVTGFNEASSNGTLRSHGYCSA